MKEKETQEKRSDPEASKATMRRGMLEFVVLLIISRGKTYASDILKELKCADLLVVEGTLYPLLSRLKSDGLLEYIWEESKSGPPRKYYTLTESGNENINHLKNTWKSLTKSIESLLQ